MRNCLAVVQTEQVHAAVCRPVSCPSGQDAHLSQGVPSSGGNRERSDPSSQDSGPRSVACN